MDELDEYFKTKSEAIESLASEERHYVYNLYMKEMIKSPDYPNNLSKESYQSFLDEYGGYYYS